MSPRILTIDIETAPAIVYSFGLRNQNHSIDQIIQSPYVLCFAAKWHDEDEVMFFKGDSTMVLEAHRLLDEADVVVHFNGNSFDVPHLNREMWLLGLPPYSPFQPIDLLKVARKQFRFISNKLDHLVQEAGLGHKLHHSGFKMWPQVMNGDPEAWELFEEYNKTDVVLTEALYDKMLPWIPGHPNVLLYNELPGQIACPTCGSGDFQQRGTRQLATGIYQQYQCNTCGAWFRDTKRRDGSTVR